MIGQSFAPLPGGTATGPGGPAGGGGGAQGGPQEAISVLKLRFPKLFGASAPAPSQLLTSPGSGGLPAQGMGQSPAIQAILQAVLGSFKQGGMAAPSAPGGMMGSMLGGGGGGGAAGAPGPMPQMPMPRVDYIPQPPMPGGTAGPNQRPVEPEYGRRLAGPGKFAQ